MEKLTLKVEGMTCQGCVKGVTQALRQVPGVKDAQVVLDPGQAEVTYDPAHTGPAQLRAAIVDAGYESP